MVIPIERLSCMCWRTICTARWQRLLRSPLALQHSTMSAARTSLRTVNSLQRIPKRGIARARGPAAASRPKITPQAANPLQDASAPTVTAQTHRWSSGVVIALSSAVAAAMYAVGLVLGENKKTKDIRLTRSVRAGRAPTQADFDLAIEQLKSRLPEECVSTDEHELSTHGIGEWNYQNPAILPGACVLLLSAVVYVHLCLI